MKVSIIILTYNSEKYIKKLVESINEANTGLDYEILIVDNDSTDKTVEVSKTLKNVKVVETGSNMGFARGINFGAKKAIGDYLLFINPDATWQSGTVDALVSVFEKNDKVGIVGGKIINSKGESERSAGRFLKTFESLATAVGMDNVFGIRFSPEKERVVDFVSGGFMMVKRALFEKISGFDERLFMYVEDMELCYRAKLSGFLTVFSPAVVIIHESHGSASRGFAIQNIIKGLVYFQEKHGNSISHLLIHSVFKTKAIVLVMTGKIINNKYLSDTYSEVLK